MKECVHSEGDACSATGCCRRVCMGGRGCKKKKKPMGNFIMYCILKAHPVVLITNNDITFPRMTTKLSQLQGEILLTSW